MRYAYYPGCSLEATGRPYQESVVAVSKTLGIELVELEDWNCCGATAYMSINEALSFSLSARNLCQAKKIGDTLVTACSACYTNLRKTETYLAEFPEILDEPQKTMDGIAIAEIVKALAARHDKDVEHRDSDCVPLVLLCRIRAQTRETTQAPEHVM